MNEPSSRVAELMEKHLAGETGPGEAAELRRELAARPDLARHLFGAARMHRLLQAGLGAGSGHARRAGLASGRQSSPGRSGRIRRLLLPLSAAAVVALGLFGWYLVATGPLGQAQGPGLVVTRDERELPLTAGDALFAGDRLRAGARADLGLSDGSSVRLDAGTALVLARPGPGERARLDLAEGRVFLRVAKAPGRFRVLAGPATVEALGTVFGVALENGLAVSGVYEGRVRLAAGTGTLELGRGEAARAAAGAAPVRSAEDPAEAFAWARDWTRFEDRPLGEVLDWIAANSPSRFNAPAAVRSQRVSIAIAGEPMSRVLATLLASCGLRSSTHDNDVTLQGETP